MANGIFDRLASETGVIELGGTGGISQNPEIVIGYGAPPSAPQPSTGSIYLRRDAPNAALMLYVAAASLWWPISVSAFSDISVANEAALTSFDVSSLPDGMQAYVQSHRTYWTLRTQALTLRANELIASSAVTRQWIRESTAHLDWALQYAPNVFVDPVAGNNENDGLTNVTALLNMEEVARRVPVLVQPIAVNYVGTGSPATALSWSPVIRWLSSVSASPPTITINGVETTAALPAGATGIINTATNNVLNVPPTLTDTGGAGVVWVPGMIIRAAGGQWCTVLRALGAGAAETSIWYNAAGTAAVAAPAGGVTYLVVTYTQIPNVLMTLAQNAIFASSQVPAITFKFCSVLAFSFSNQVVGGGVTFVNCSFPTSGLAPAYGCTLTFRASYIRNAGSFFVGAQIICAGCGIDRTGANASIRAQINGRMIFVDTVIDGQGVCGGLSAGSTAFDTLFPGGEIAVNNVGIMNCGGATENTIDIKRGGKLNIAGPLWGATNANKGTCVNEGGQAYVANNVIPTLAAAGQELELDKSATAPTVVLQLPAAAAALTTWAQWVAAPFARNAMSYLTGAAIMNDV